METVPVLDDGAAQDFFIGSQQFLAGQTQVEWNVSDGTASSEFAQRSFDDEFLDQESSGVASSQGKNFDEESSVLQVQIRKS